MRASGVFVSYYLQLLLYTLGPLALFGTVIYACKLLFCFLVGERAGRPLLLAATALSTPLRELGHAGACVLFFHRIEDMCLLDLHSPDGELGFVEHSYRPRSFVAQLGNFFFAVLPMLTVLAAVSLLLLIFAREWVFAVAAETGVLAAGERSPFSLLEGAFGLFLLLFEGGSPLGLVPLFVLLCTLALGAHLSFDDIKQSLGGLLPAALLYLLVAGVSFLFDERVRRMITGGLRAFALFSSTVLLVVLCAVLALVLLGALFFLVRKGTGLDERE